MGFHHQLGLGCLCLLLLTPAHTRADEHTINNHFSGFASLGVASNDNTELGFRREAIQDEGSRGGNIEWRNDSLLGLQWQTQWSYQLETTAQVIIKDRFNNSLEESIEWAFVHYRPLDGVDIRAGRLGTDIFMLSDYRQVGYALPWVRPPHETYGLLSFYHFDGIDLTKRFDIRDSTLSLKTFYAQFNREYPISTRAGENYRLVFSGGGASVNWELDEWKVRYSYADVEIQNNNHSVLTDALSAASAIWPDASNMLENFLTKNKHVKYQQLGMIYDNNQWWLQAEATRLNSEPQVISSSRHFYLSLGRRIEAFTLYATHSYVRSLQTPDSLTVATSYPSATYQQLNNLNTLAAKTINATRSNQTSVGLGTRWDFASKMALKLQADRITVEANGDALWLKPKPRNYVSSAQTAHVISLSLDVLF